MKAIFKVQQNLLLAIKPLLNILDSALSPEDNEKVRESIQLICSGNLQLNRLRRAATSQHLKADVCKQMFKVPVTHNSLFGDDFSKTTEECLKQISALHKASKKIFFSSPVSLWRHYPQKPL